MEKYDGQNDEERTSAEKDQMKLYRSHKRASLSESLEK